MIDFLKYKTFKQFYWKHAFLRLGLPWGIATGIIISLSHNDWSLNGILSKNTLIEVVGFPLAGFLLAYLWGKATWKRFRELDESQGIDEKESGEKDLKDI